MDSSNIFLLLQLILVPFLFVSANSHGLKVGFYAHSCPEAEVVVRDIIHQTMSVAPSLAGPLLRMFAHDCFVRGCYGSILLESSNNTSEKDAIPNLSLRGFQIIDKVKVALEKTCPGVVSCADILALVVRDVVVQRGGYYCAVETGRRDGKVSDINEVEPNLIDPSEDVASMKDHFKLMNLTVKDLVVLSGAHTLGTSHCSTFINRIYNFSATFDTDPTLDSEYVPHLRSRCPENGPDRLVEMDPGSYKSFDLSYYSLVAKRRGLFQSDAALLDDLETRAYVESHRSGDPTTGFFVDFGVAMVNFGRVGVLSGTHGEVRKVCSKVN